MLDGLLQILLKKIRQRIFAIKNYKKGLEEFKATADENFKKVEAFFASK